jgi:hypothetical protein
MDLWGFLKTRTKSQFQSEQNTGESVDRHTSKTAPLLVLPNMIKIQINLNFRNGTHPNSSLFPA